MRATDDDFTREVVSVESATDGETITLSCLHQITLRGEQLRDLKAQEVGERRFCLDCCVAFISRRVGTRRAKRVDAEDEQRETGNTDGPPSRGEDD